MKVRRNKRDRGVIIEFWEDGPECPPFLLAAATMDHDCDGWSVGLYSGDVGLLDRLAG